MNISPDWRIRTDPNNVILQRRKVNTRGKHVGQERWESVAHFPSHKAALKAMTDYEIREIPQEYEILVAKIDELHARIEALPLDHI